MTHIYDDVTIPDALALPTTIPIVEFTSDLPESGMAFFCRRSSMTDCASDILLSDRLSLSSLTSANNLTTPDSRVKLDSESGVVAAYRKNGTNLINFSIQFTSFYWSLPKTVSIFCGEPATTGGQSH